MIVMFAWFAFRLIFQPNSIRRCRYLGVREQARGADALHVTEPCLSHQHAYCIVINCDEPNNRTGVHCPGLQQQPLSQSLADPACCLLACLLA
jgi:hypothetical protein